MKPLWRMLEYLHVFVIIPLLLTTVSDSGAAVYLSNLSNRWVDPANPSVNDIGNIENLFPGQYTFTARFTTGAGSFALNSVTLEFLSSPGLFAPQSWTNLDVQLYRKVGKHSKLLVTLGRPTINSTPTQWPHSSTYPYDFTTYIDFHAMRQVILQPFSQYQVSASDPTNSPSAAGLLFSVSSNYTTLDDWQMGPTSGNAWGVGQFLKLAVDAATVDAQFTLSPVQTSDPYFGVQTNSFGFTINGTSNLVIVVEASANLANPVWSPLATNTLTGGSSYFSDPQWTNHPGRFYRLRSL